MKFMQLNSLQNVFHQKLLLPALIPLFHQTTQILHFSKLIQTVTEFESERARAIVRLIRLGFFSPSSHSYCKLLSECSKMKSLGKGKEIHAQVIRTGFSQDVKIHNHLINLYSICHFFQSAQNLFDEVPLRAYTCWYALISEYARNGLEKEAITLFDQMLLSGCKCTEFILPSVLKACSITKNLNKGKQIHGIVIATGYEHDAVVANSLIFMYANCGVFLDSKKLFDEIPEKNLCSWNTLCSSYVWNGRYEEALDLFQEMVTSGIKPEEMFDEVPLRGYTSWYALMSEYARNGLEKEAIMLFDQMLLSGFRCTEFIFPSVLKACSITKNLNKGKQIHGIVIATGFENDLFVATSLVFMYENCGEFLDSKKLFDEIPQKDVRSWNALFSSYVWNCRYEEALGLFQGMVTSGIKPDESSLRKITTASTHYNQRSIIHAFFIKLGYERVGDFEAA